MKESEKCYPNLVAIMRTDREKSVISNKSPVTENFQGNESIRR